MDDVHREYLKNMLFQINRWRLDIKDTDSIDITSLDTLKNSKAGLTVLKSILDESYFKMPLIRNQQLTRGQSLLRGGFTGMVNKGKVVGEEFLDYFDGREMHEEERINLDKAQIGYYEMANIYERQDDFFKKEMLSKNGSEYYELNLDIIANRIAFNKIRQNYVNAILPTINAYIWQLKLRAGVSNKDISKELDYITQRLRTAFFDEPNISEEALDIVKLTAPVKAITTAGMLAFRPVLLIKELAIGLYKGISLASTKVYGTQQFGLDSYMKAMGKLATIDKKFSLEWNLIDGMNHFYGFANKDIGNSVQKMQTSRRGILKGLSPWMYATSTAPDYYNRLSLFVAKMIEDGSYDAHSLDSKGYLLYDPSKDKRFSKYFANRHLHKNENGKYIPAKNDLEYNTQRNLYLLIMSEINEDRDRVGWDKLKEDQDLLTHAYSEKERLSFKSFTDTVYGYYDKDSSSLMHTTWYGIIFLQFLQFWPGKMTQ
jgi:hypothetical protein